MLLSYETDFDEKRNDGRSDNDDNARVVAVNLNIINSTLSLPCDVSFSIFKRNMKFDGSAKGISVNFFLEGWEELHGSRKVDKIDIYNSTVDLFQGSALMWGLSIRGWVSVAALKRDFLREVLWSEIKNPKQKAKERVYLF